MTTSEKQQRFAVCIAHLILQAQEAGYAVTFGDAYRDPRVHGEWGEKKAYGSATSNHKRRFAVDLNLFRAGRYLASTEDHRPLGEWWESYGKEQDLPLRWGGRYQDGNHYEWAE